MTQRFSSCVALKPGNAALAEFNNFSFKIKTNTDNPPNIVEKQYTLLQTVDALNPLLYPQDGALIPTPRDIDVDGDQIADLRWNLTVPDLTAHTTNFGPLWKRLGSSLGALGTADFDVDRLSPNATMPPVQVVATIIAEGQSIPSQRAFYDWYNMSSVA